VKKPKPHTSVSSTEHGRARATIEELQARNAEVEEELEAMVARQQPSNAELATLATQGIVAGFSLTEKDNRIAELEAELEDMSKTLNVAIKERNLAKRGLKQNAPQDWDVATALKWWENATDDERDEFVAGNLSDTELDRLYGTLFGKRRVYRLRALLRLAQGLGLSNGVLRGAAPRGR
jgi:hypothetical protein